jgi:hypothetical protein
MAELANGAFDYYRRRLRELEEGNRRLKGDIAKSDFAPAFRGGAERARW